VSGRAGRTDRDNYQRIGLVLKRKGRWVRFFDTAPPYFPPAATLEARPQVEPEIVLTGRALSSEFDLRIQLDRARVARIIELAECGAGDVCRQGDELMPV
jgi:hypothetical protein